MIQPSLDPPVANEPPWANRVTDYDRRHFVTYLRLLDADADGAHPDEVARIVLGIDPGREPERARHAHTTHLARARWMTATGYRDLLTTHSR